MGKKRSTTWSSGYEVLAQSFSHHHVNIECLIRESTERQKVEKETDVLFRGTRKRGMGHFVKNLQKSIWQPCHKRTSNCQIQMAFQKGGRKERRY